MARELANLPREGYSAYEHISGSHVRRGNGHNAIYAMHWDGTYRDRVAGPDRRFWPEISGFNPRPASLIAKHLEE